MNTSTFTTEKLAKLAMMTAISLVLLFLIRIPVGFLEYEPADVPIYITTFAYGPAAGLAVTFVVCVIQAFLLGGNGLVGCVMHFIATGLVAVVIGIMYKRDKSRKTAVIALVTGVILTTVVMCILNLIITPIFLNTPREVVIGMLPTMIIPFNLAKAGINSLLTFIIYKHISGFLHG